MKNFFIVLFLTLGSILISGCSLIEQEPVDRSAATKQIIVLQQQMSGVSSQMNSLKKENEQLKNENKRLNTTMKKNETKTSTTSPTNSKEMPLYTVKTEQGDGNADIIYVYTDGKMIFKLDPIDGRGTYYKIVGKILFVDYGTAVGGRTIKLFDVGNNGKIVFETRYNGKVKIEGDRLYFDFSFSPDFKGISCDNYEEIKNMGGSVNYEQKRYFNFKEDKLVKLGKVYCAYGE